MLAVTGRRTSIVRALERMTGDTVLRIESVPDLSDPTAVLSIPHADRYLFAAGVLYGRPVLQLSSDEIVQTCAVNFINVMRACEMILARQIGARICVVGSESAEHGSYDELYAASKAALHAYVLTRETRWPQQLVCCSPPIIGDSGMTYRRNDYPAVLESGRPIVSAEQVARCIRRLLYDNPTNPVTNAIVRVAAADITP